VKKKVLSLLCAAALLAVIGGVIYMSWSSGEKITTAKLNEKDKHTSLVWVASLAKGTPDTRSVLKAPKGITVLKVGIIPDEIINVDAVDYMTLYFINAGADGSGVDVIAYKDFNVGGPYVAYDFIDFGTVLNAALSTGWTITFSKGETLNGMLQPSLCVVIEYQITS